MSAVDLAAESLLADARAQAGLDDFGDVRFREGLVVLLETIERNFDAAGQAAQRETLVGRLATRLQMQDAFNQHPEILEQELRSPVIVTGLPRSGTSALFNLLNSDPDARGLLLWESYFPQPLPGRPPQEEDPRFIGLKQYLDENRDPEFAKIHYVAAENPEECCIMQVYSFDGVAMGWEYLLEPYHSWFKSHSLAFMYEEHRNHLKLLQWQRPGMRWLLKAPAHMWAIDEIIKVFPDVCLVWGHREPVGVTASICSMTEMIFNNTLGPQGEAELHTIGPRIMDWYATSLERGLEQRATLAPARVFDYSFTGFIEGPAATVEGIYSHFGFPLPDATRVALSAHIEKNRQGKHGKHEYNLAHYGLTEQQVLDRYAFYTDSPLLVG